jgi:hypothetical protein
MDRVLVSDAALLQSTDILSTNKFGMIAQAFLARAILGVPTLVDGLACNPTSPASLQVTVGVGSIYALDPVDATAYNDLGVDNNTIVKQGILYNPVTLTITPPTTAGYSQVFLIQAILQDIDTGASVVSYFNPAILTNPLAQPFAGPNNSGQSQFTIRSCACAIGLKPGAAAPSGTQTMPAPDFGYSGLYAITVANGQATITSTSIAQLASAPFLAKNGKLPQIPTGVQNETWSYAPDTSAGGPAQATNASTSTTSAVLNFASVPAWVAAGMKAFDLTTPGAINGGQTVLSTTSTTVTLSANVNATVANGDQIAFSNNALVASVSPAPTQLVPGLSVKIKVIGTNSGPATLNLNNLGGVSIHRANGAALQPGDLTANMVVGLSYDGAAFQVENFGGFTSVTTNNNTYTINIPYATDSSVTANSVVAAFAPAITSLSAGTTVEVRIANTNTGPTTITVNALPPVPITDSAAQPLRQNTLVAGEVALLIFDGTNFQLLSLTGGSDLIDTSVTFTVHGAGANFTDLNAAFEYLSKFKITHNGLVTLKLAGAVSGTAQQFTYNVSVFCDHPQNHRIQIRGAPMLAACPTTDAAFSLTGSSSANRSSDTAANLNMLRTKFATELHFIGSTGIEVDGVNLGLLDGLLITGDGTGTSVPPDHPFGNAGLMWYAAAPPEQNPANVTAGSTGMGIAIVGFGGWCLYVGQGGSFAPFNNGPFIVMGSVNSAGAEINGGAVCQFSGPFLAFSNAMAGLSIESGSVSAFDSACYSECNGHEGINISTKAGCWGGVGTCRTWKNGTWGVAVNLHSMFTVNNPYDFGTGGNANASGPIWVNDMSYAAVGGSVNTTGSAPAVGTVGNNQAMIATG